MSQGKVLSGSRKLHKIESMLIKGHASVDCEDWAKEVKRHYETKWGCSRLQDRLNVLDYIRRTDGCLVDIEAEELSNAFKCVRSKHRNDRLGVSVAGLEMLFVSQPSTFEKWLASVMACSKQMESLQA